MAKKRLLRRKLNFWDLSALAVVGYYIYGVYNGLTSPAWSVFSLFGQAFFFAYVVSWVFLYINRRRSK